MDRQLVLALLAAIVALSLVGSPVTMADWGEQASFSVEPIEKAEAGEETPLLKYDNLSLPAQTAVRRAIESPDGSHVVYGQEDWPDRFFYSDYSAPGQGLYDIAYEGQYYRLYTAAGGGFPFVYWLFELPFIVYGGLLGGVAYGSARGRFSTRTAALTTAVGITFHLLGPEFDFPLLAPMQFAILGVLATTAAVIGLIRASARETTTMDPEETDRW